MKFVSLFRLIHLSSFYLFIPPSLHSVIVCACEYLSPTFSILLRHYDICVSVIMWIHLCGYFLDTLLLKHVSVSKFSNNFF